MLMICYESKIVFVKDIGVRHGQNSMKNVGYFPIETVTNLYKEAYLGNVRKTILVKHNSTILYSFLKVLKRREQLLLKTRQPPLLQRHKKVITSL